MNHLSSSLLLLLVMEVIATLIPSVQLTSSPFPPKTFKSSLSPSSPPAWTDTHNFTAGPLPPAAPITTSFKDPDSASRQSGSLSSREDGSEHLVPKSMPHSRLIRALSVRRQVPSPRSSGPSSSSSSLHQESPSHHYTSFPPYPHNLSVVLVKWPPEPSVRVSWKYIPGEEVPPSGHVTIPPSASFSFSHSNDITDHSPVNQLEGFRILYHPLSSRFRYIVEVPAAVRNVTIDRLIPGAEYVLTITPVPDHHVLITSHSMHTLPPPTSHLPSSSSPPSGHDFAPPPPLSAQYYLFSNSIRFIAPQIEYKNNRFNKFRSSSLVVVKEDREGRGRNSLRQVEVSVGETVVVIFILCGWLVVIIIFVKKWGKIRGIVTVPQSNSQFEPAVPHSLSGIVSLQGGAGGGPCSPPPQSNNPMGTCSSPSPSGSYSNRQSCRRKHPVLLHQRSYHQLSLPPGQLYLQHSQHQHLMHRLSHHQSLRMHRRNSLSSILFQKELESLNLVPREVASTSPVPTLNGMGSLRSKAGSPTPSRLYQNMKRTKSMDEEPELDHDSDDVGDKSNEPVR